MKPRLLLLLVVGLVSCTPREGLGGGDSNYSLEPHLASSDGGGPSPLTLRSSLPLVEETDQQITSQKGSDGLPDGSLQERHEPDEPANLAQTDRRDLDSREPTKRGQFLSTIKSKSKWKGKKPKYSKVNGTRKTDSIIFLNYTDDDQRKDEKSPSTPGEQFSSRSSVNHKYTKRVIKGIGDKFKNVLKPKPQAKYSRVNKVKNTNYNNEDLVSSEDSDSDDETRPLLQSQRKNWKNSLSSQRQNSRHTSHSRDIAKRGFVTKIKTKFKNLFKKKPRYSKLRHSKPDRSTEVDSDERDNGGRYNNPAYDKYDENYEDEDDDYDERTPLLFKRPHHRSKRGNLNLLERGLRSFVVLSSHLQKNMTHNMTSLPADNVTEELNKGQADGYLAEELNENQAKGDEGEEYLNEDQAKEDEVEQYMTESLNEDQASEDESEKYEGQEDEYEAESEDSGLGDEYDDQDEENERFSDEFGVQGGKVQNERLGDDFVVEGEKVKEPECPAQVGDTRAQADEYENHYDEYEAWGPAGNNDQNDAYKTQSNKFRVQ